jgi:hypothetical protein
MKIKMKEKLAQKLYGVKKMNNDKEKEVLKAVRITITYYGVGSDLKEATADAWNDISNDRNFQAAYIEEEECDVEETNFDSLYLDDLRKNI